MNNFTQQQLDTFAQEAVNLKALRDQANIILGEGHYFTHQIAFALQSFMRIFENFGVQNVGQTFLNAGLTADPAIASLASQQDFITYMQGYVPTAELNTELLFSTPQVQVLMMEAITKQHIASYIIGVTNVAHYG